MRTMTGDHLPPRGSTLRTRRLRLEPVTAEDASSLHAHWTEPDVLRFLWDGRVIAREEVQDAIDVSLHLFDKYDVGLWTVRDAGDGALIGCAGFWYFHRPPELELVLSLSRAYWGRGLARESAAALLDHVFDTLNWTAVQASADAPNVASISLMQRIGMRHAGERPGEFGRIHVFRIAADEWHAVRAGD